MKILIAIVGLVGVILVGVLVFGNAGKFQNMTNKDNSQPQTQTTNQGQGSFKGLISEPKAIQAGQTIPVSVYFDASGETISGVALRLSSPGVTVGNLRVNPQLLSSGDFSCPIALIDNADGGVTNVDIACVNITPEGLSATGQTLLGTFDVQSAGGEGTATFQIDPNLSMITRKEDAKNILGSSGVIKLTYE